MEKRLLIDFEEEILKKIFSGIRYIGRIVDKIFENFSNDTISCIFMKKIHKI